MRPPQIRRAPPANAVLPPPASGARRSRPRGGARRPGSRGSKHTARSPRWGAIQLKLAQKRWSGVGVTFGFGLGLRLGAFLRRRRGAGRALGGGLRRGGVGGARGFHRPAAGSGGGGGGGGMGSRDGGRSRSLWAYAMKQTIEPRVWLRRRWAFYPPVRNWLQA